ncbi:MAG: ribonuclease III [Dehalococcoidia bacterium]|nr:ribonuclease III [Dehalococcoidia bacterium]
MRPLEDLEKTIGMTFSDRALLRQAFLHSSFIYEAGGNPWESNERLEFLGDAFLGYVIAELLYKESHEMSEGEMTRLRASLVNRDILARIAASLDLGSYLYLGRGEESSKGRERPANLGRVYEALIGAILLDQGEVVARDFVLTSMRSELESVASGSAPVDYKSRLQELAQRLGEGYPIYRTIEAEGPPHARKFTIEVLIADHVMGVGSGPSKQAAEKEAAAVAFNALSEQ